MNIKRCHTKDCDFNKTGVCVENRLPDCPNVKLEEAEEKELADKEVSKAVQDDAMLLYPGREMGLSEVTKITYKYHPKWIVVIGDSDSGKTTLLATIFDLFQMGPFADLYFSGSRSLIGFEIRCHDSRSESGQLEPKTPKTNAREEFKFLHLELKRTEKLSSPPIHLLISDISGEKFKAARNSSIEMKNLTILLNADHIIYLIDGEKLLQPTNLNVVMTQLRFFLRKAIDDGMMPLNSDITIAVSKWDKLFDKDIEIKSLIEEPIKREFGAELTRINFTNIASRPYPLTEEVEMGHGLGDMISKWTNETAGEMQPFIDKSREHKRHIDNFLVDE